VVAVAPRRTGPQPTQPIAGGKRVAPRGSGGGVVLDGKVGQAPTGRMFRSVAGTGGSATPYWFLGFLPSSDLLQQRAAAGVLALELALAVGDDHLQPGSPVTSLLSAPGPRRRDAGVCPPRSSSAPGDCPPSFLDRQSSDGNRGGSAWRAAPASGGRAVARSCMMTRDAVVPC